jgi:ubiquinol-cytochrome c reductase cytochrome c1 subunit
MSPRKIMVALALLSVFSVPAHADEAGVKLDSANFDVSDVVQLQSGARTFVNYCLNCHSASMVRYNTLTQIGLSEQQIKDNLLFTADKVGEPMDIAFPKKDAKAAFGVVPPDLSVIARARSPEWLYTYLRSFYRDPSRSTGWNNTVYPNVAMPNVLWSLQGERVLKQVPVMLQGKPLEAHGHALSQAEWQTVKAGSMTEAEFDRTVRDLVTFMTWMGEPHQVKRHQIGVWVVFALIVLIGLTFALKSADWKDVH